MDKPRRRQECLIKSEQKLGLRDIDRVRRKTGDRHESAKDHHRKREPTQHGTVTPRKAPDPIRARDEETEDIDKLPAKWVEKPGSLDRPRWKIYARR